MSQTNATSAEDPSYLSMLNQLQLKPDQVPAEMREGLYKKMGLSMPNAASS